MAFIALIEDSDADYDICKKAFLKEIKHVRYKTMQGFKDSDTSVYSAVISDLGLPDCFGFETLRDIKSVYTGKVFVLTGLAGCLLTGTYCHKMIEAGATDVFTKDHLLKPIYAEVIRRVLLNA